MKQEQEVKASIFIKAYKSKTQSTNVVKHQGSDNQQTGISKVNTGLKSVLECKKTDSRKRLK